MDQNIFVLLHVLAVVLLLGPVTTAVFLFPRAAREAHEGQTESRGKVSLLYAVSKGYAMWSLLVPLLGFGAFFMVDGAMKNYFIHIGILLSVIIWALLFFYIVPKQRSLVVDLGLENDDEDPVADEAPDADWVDTPGRLMMANYAFTALWALTFVLMFIKPEQLGS